MGTEDAPTRRHFFISHHHADDSRVDELTDLLTRAGNDVRNSSVRMKPENQRRFDEGRVSDEAIRRVLRMKISWATTVVVLVGKIHIRGLGSTGRLSKHTSRARKSLGFMSGEERMFRCRKLLRTTALGWLLGTQTVLSMRSKATKIPSRTQMVRRVSRSILERKLSANVPRLHVCGGPGFRLRP